MPMFELLNTYDRDGNLIGASTMDEILRDGLIYRAANIWLMNDKNQILLQKVGKAGHKNYGRWNTSVTGKLSAGDTPISGARREMAEELGLDLPEADFIFLDTLFYERPSEACAFADIWLVRIGDIPAENFVLAEGEVAEVKWYDLDQVKNWRESGIDIGSRTFDWRLKPLLKWLADS